MNQANKKDIKIMLNDVRHCFLCHSKVKYYTVYIDHDPLLGLFGYEVNHWRCPNCGETDAPFNENSRKYSEAHIARADFLLSKNFPPDKFPNLYISEAEVVKYVREDNIRNGEKPDASWVESDFFNTVWNGERLYSRISFNRMKRLIDAFYNITSPDEWKQVTKEYVEQNLLKYRNPQKYPGAYVSEEEAVEHERNGEFKFGKAHLDFFVYNLEWEGKRIYLRKSLELYDEWATGFIRLQCPPYGSIDYPDTPDFDDLSL